MVISVAYGEEKAPAVAAAIRGGLVSGLITHTALAHALLDDDAHRSVDTWTADAAAR